MCRQKIGSATFSIVRRTCAPLLLCASGWHLISSGRADRVERGCWHAVLWLAIGETCTGRSRSLQRA